LSESGASAVEVALRVALLAQRHRGQHRRTRFLSLEEAYHGDTAGSVSIGRSEPFHRGLGPLLFDALRTLPPHLIELRERLDPEAAEAVALNELEGVVERHGESLAALVIEPRVQGAAGIWTHSDAWLREVVTLARAAGALVICDEVATGFGRTGDLFASAGAGMVPDILCLGKGLSGGYLPLSATVVGEPLFELFTALYEEHRTLYYGHTFTGNPLACAAARASLRAFASEDTVARGRRLGERLGAALDTLAELPLVAAVRRRGVMCGVELADTSAAGVGGRRLGREVTLAARRRGVIVRPLGDVVVLNPALVMTDTDCDAVVAALAAAIGEVAAGADHGRPVSAGRSGVAAG
ncbi:MAG: aminotransferase class III-fold pyridoxal phosphate-dependent enzyme, partial [Solirubrobacteraceae bacterium]